jgi:CubicO group peptidase (beta-lactamase class C family)
MKKLVLLLALLVPLALFSQTKLSNGVAAPSLFDAKSPEMVGISPERLQRLDRSLKALVDKNTLPGFVAIVTRNGQIVYHEAYGYADNTSKRTMKTDDIFRIASMSKAITSAAVLMLFEEGKFSLDDPISKFIPEFKNPTVLSKFNWKDSTYTTEPAKSEITIRQLLNHTSGISYGVIAGDDRFGAINGKAGIVDLYTTKAIKISDNIKKLARLPLIHHPGEKYTYGLNSDVLGYLIEIWSGESFDVYLRKHLFEPLGMNDTYFYVPDAKKDRVVSVQKPDSLQNWVRFPTTFYDPNYPISGAKTFFSGGAGLSSTAKDYATFLQMLLNGGAYNGKRFLSRTTVETFTQANQIGDLWGGEKGDSHFSLGFGVLTKHGQDKGGVGSEGKFSWGGYFNTNYFADPKEKIVAVLMKQTQNTDGDNSEQLFTRMIYQSIDD